MWFSRSLLALFAYLFPRYKIFLISFIICIMHTDIAVYLDRNRDRIRLPRLFLYTQRNKVRSLLSTFNLYEVQQLRFEMYAMIRVVRFKKRGLHAHAHAYMLYHKDSERAAYRFLSFVKLMQSKFTQQVTSRTSLTTMLIDLCLFTS